MQVRRKKRPPRSAQSILHQISEVVHNVERSRFELYVADDLVGVLGYSIDESDGGTVLTIMHTVLYDEFAGHRLATRLTESALDYAVAQSARVRPVCSYTRHYLTKHRGVAPIAA